MGNSFRILQVNFGTCLFHHQLDSHGDIFAQAFQRKEHQDEVSSEVENTAGLVARRWVEELESQIKQYLNVGEHAVAKDVTCIFNGENLLNQLTLSFPQAVIIGIYKWHRSI